MIRPDEILFAVGGRIMDRTGSPILESGRVNQVQGSSFSRASAAWARVQRAKWAKVPAGVPRWEVDDNGRLVLGIHSTDSNLLGDSSELSSTSPMWASLSTATTFPAAGTSILQGRTVHRFTYQGSTTAPGLTQDLAAPSTSWVAVSAIVEAYGVSTGFAMRLNDLGSSKAIIDGELAWDGTFTVTRSTEGGASTTYPVLGSVQRLGLGPNNGAAYRVTMSARLTAPGNNLRATLYGVGLAPTASTFAKATYLHHAQFTKSPGGAPVMVNESSSPVTVNGETFVVPKVNAPGGPLTMYSVNYEWDRPGMGGAPAPSTTSGRRQLALARGWTSTDGKRFVGGGVYERQGQVVYAGSTGVAYTPGAKLEELVSISTAGVLTYEVSVDGGAVSRATSTGTLRPSRNARIPSYRLSKNHHQVVAKVLARGVHSIEDFRGLLP